jgi:effector-binding domain-containing protein
MDIEIITKALEFDVYGFSGIVSNGDFGGTAFKLMDKMWQIVKSNSLGNKGKNIWIYEQGNIVFAGVELEGIPKPDIILEHKSLSFTKYAYYKHIGPYNLIKQVGQAMTNEIKKKGFEVILPYIEIYGHWTNDESKLETELLMCLK